MTNSASHGTGISSPLPKHMRPLIAGEVLLDVFPDGDKVLGGAPFNVAWNLQGLGLAPRLISAVGADAEGDEIRARMEDWGLDTTGLQISTRWPTGKVQVALREGQPSFDILDKQAYDDIQFPKFSISPEEFSLLYVGSLAYRHETSRRTLRRLIGESGLPRFVDINIRPPWFDHDWLPDLLGDARWIKLNDHELGRIAKMECRTREAIQLATDQLRQEYNARVFFITCGSEGAFAVDETGGIVFAEAPKARNFVDTVGAGDALAAATILGISQRRPLNGVLQSAVEFASRACSLQGATTLDRNHYEEFKSEIA